MNATSLDITAIITGIGGGLALFLYGMHKMTEALRTVAGADLKNVLAKLTTNRFTGAASGAAITSVVQSSSVTTVMVVGFVSAGLMTFSQSVGVIMGANVGTTVTAQIIAFNITEYSLAMIAVGFLLEVLAKRRSQRVRHYGVALMGLGMLFFGMELISNTTAPLRTYEPFIQFMQEMQTPLYGILAGCIFTAVVQSSSATTGIVIVLATQGLVTLESSIAIILGANLGTCITAALSAIGRPRDAIKAAMVHILFNFLGVALLVGWIGPFADLVRVVSPAASELTGTARLAAEVPRQIANAHTLFNLGVTVVLIGFSGTLANLVEKIVPKPKNKLLDESQPMYLNQVYLDQPAVALDRVKLELKRLISLVREMVQRAEPIAIKGTEDDLLSLREQDEKVDNLHASIVRYLAKLQVVSLVEPLPRRVQEYFSVANYLENLGDTVETTFVQLGHRRIQRDLKLDEHTREILAGLSVHTNDIFSQAVFAFEQSDLTIARTIVASNTQFDQRLGQVRNDIAKLTLSTPAERLEEYRFSIEFTDGLKRVQTLARRISKAIIAAHEEERTRDSDQE